MKTKAQSAIGIERSLALKAKLPAWHFEPYGKEGAVACYPPGLNADNFLELAAITPITSVCGPFYVVTGS